MGVNPPEHQPRLILQRKLFSIINQLSIAFCQNFQSNRVQVGTWGGKIPATFIIQELLRFSRTCGCFYVIHVLSFISGLSVSHTHVTIFEFL